MPRIQLIYKLDDINADDGIDLYEIAPALMHFGDLIRSSNDALGYEQQIDIRVKPFENGSFITEFILHQPHITTLLNYLKSTEGNDLRLLIGFIVGAGAVIRFVHGKVKNFRKEKDKIIYYNDKGEEYVTSLPEHRIIQSPLVQNNYYNSVVIPLERFPSASGISFRINEEGEPEHKFTLDDKPAFEEYLNSSLEEDFIEQTETPMNGVYIKPKRGSYSGTERAYSFTMGETILWPVTIEDERFLGRLRRGDIRLYSGDLLKVDLEMRQKKSRSNKVLTSYAILSVIEYHQYEKPHQLDIDDSIE